MTFLLRKTGPQTNFEYTFLGIVGSTRVRYWLRVRLMWASFRTKEGITLTLAQSPQGRGDWRHLLDPLGRLRDDLVEVEV